MSRDKLFICSLLRQFTFNISILLKLKKLFSFVQNALKHREIDVYKIAASLMHRIELEWSHILLVWR